MTKEVEHTAETSWISTVRQTVGSTESFPVCSRNCKIVNQRKCFMRRNVLCILKSHQQPTVEVTLLFNALSL
jgi:hypothetical protein